MINLQKSFFQFFVHLVFFVLLLSGCQNEKATLKEVNNDQPKTEKPIDWEGVYRGTIPCDDCEGIKMEVRLSENNTYQLFYQLFGKDDSVQSKGGTIRWMDDGSLVLDGMDEDSGMHRYRIGSNFAKILTPDGKEHAGDFATAYILKKEAYEIRDKKWELFYLGNSIIKWKSENPQVASIILPHGDNKLVGNGGCNRLMGLYEIESKSAIKFTQLITTKKMCPDIQIEYNLVDFLRKVKSYSYKDDVLIFYQNPSNPLLKFRYNYF